MSSIKNRLSWLLEYHDMSINRLSEEVGVSRRTLTNLVNNNAKGIQFETIDKLLAFFDIQLKDFWYSTKDITYIDFGLEINQNKQNPHYEFIIDVKGNIATIDSLECYMSVKSNNKIVKKRGLINVTSAFDTEFFSLNSKKKVFVTDLSVSFYELDKENNIYDFFSIFSKELLQSMALTLFTSTHQYINDMLFKQDVEVIFNQNFFVSLGDQKIYFKIEQNKENVKIMFNDKSVLNHNSKNVLINEHSVDLNLIALDF